MVENEGRFQECIQVAICGGGISGLCLAVALCKSPTVAVKVYEASERFKEIGAGIMIWSRTWRILEDMGLSKPFSKIAHAPPDGSVAVGFDYRRSDTQEGFEFHCVQMPYGCIRFHRAEFLDVFIDSLPSGVAHFGKRLLHYSDKEGAPISLTFSDGSVATCDLLIGCDGIKSVIRGQMLRERAEWDGNAGLLELIEPIWSGTIAYRGLIPSAKLNMNGNQHRTITMPMMYCGKSKHVVGYSISQGSVVNVVSFVSEPKEEGKPYIGPWVTNCSSEDLLDSFYGWEPEVTQLLKTIETPTKWAIHQLKPLPFFVSGRVALVGDSAHAMLPHQGAGAGQAIEDAYIMASLISHSTKLTIQAALQAYEHIRMPLANHVLVGSKESGRMYEFDSEYGEDYQRLGEAIDYQWDWIRWRQPEEDLKVALDRQGARER